MTRESRRGGRSRTHWPHPSALVVPHQAPGPDRAAPGEERRWDDAPTPTAMPYAELERQQDQIWRGIDLNPGCEAPQTGRPWRSVGV
ncbi:hypothetical protein ACFWPP_10335 [Streptomyces anulatus]|uniref:hypothetical protein n=1 Tax=Streptomyces anulatus TaxID=1892 RepID=UPI00365FDD46